MRRHCVSCLFLVLIMMFVALPAADPARGCAVAPPRNKYVDIAEETALIVWDSQSKTEHFIRRASFQTDVDNFGFLVPTPTQPELHEADDKAFDELARITAPQIVTQPKPSSGGCAAGCSAAAPKAMTAGPPGDVTVVEQKRVAGHDTAVLKADDVDALSKWLTEHDYPFDPNLKDWADHYIKAKWYVTAFKIAKPEEGASKVNTKAVRMSFHTEQPFFPYREPKDPRHVNFDTGLVRLLRVYVVSDNRIKGQIGGKDGTWPGTAAWSNLVQPGDRKKVLELAKLPDDMRQGNWWLTEFEDRSYPRKGYDDVYFTASDDQRPVSRPPIIQYVSLSPRECVLCYALTACLCIPLLAWRFRR
jgi:hypothetical protein